MTKVATNFENLSAPLGLDMHAALDANRILFSEYADRDNQHALFVIGRNVAAMQAAVAELPSQSDDPVFLILVRDEQLESISKSWGGHTSASDVLDLDGEKLGEIKVHGSCGASYPTVLGAPESWVTLAENLKAGDIFSFPGVRNSDGKLEQYRALEDFNEDSFRTHILIRYWDTAAPADKANLTLTRTWPATLLVYRVLNRSRLLDEIGVADIAS